MKNLGVYLTIGVICVGIISTYAVLKYRVDETEETVEEHGGQIIQHGEQIIRMQELNIYQGNLLDKIESKF